MVTARRSKSLLSRTEKDEKPSGEILFLGLEGAGKSLLVRRLQSLWSSPRQYVDISTALVPSVGVEIHEIQYGKRGKQRLIAREVGGQMSPLWPKYYDICNTLVFVVDISQNATISQATMEMYELIRHPKVQGKHVGIVLNKGDLPCTISRKEVDWLMKLPELTRDLSWLRVFETSALTGYGSETFFEWIKSSVMACNLGYS